jgi:hypothetical protein
MDARALTNRERAERLVSSIVTLRSNPHYRMADVIYQKGQRFDDSTNKVLTLPDFDGTILKAYLQANGAPQPPNWPLLSTLVG